MGLIKLVVFGFLILSVVYLSVSLYSRSVRREKLEKAWAEENPDGGDATARAAYIDDGMIKYHKGLRPKLILLVFIVPAVAVSAILYLTN